jgi:hypothetical protein
MLFGSYLPALLALLALASISSVAAAEACNSAGYTCDPDGREQETIQP